MNKTILNSFTALTLTIASFSGAETFTLSESVVEIDTAPTNVIVFDLAAIDTLDALDIDIAGLPKPHAAGYLQQYSDDHYIGVGSFWEPDFETVAATQPDLIIVGGRTQKQLAAMSDIAPTLDTTVWGEDFLSQFYTVTEVLGGIFDKEIEVAIKLNDIKARVTQINQTAETSGNALFILASGGKISAYGPGSRFGWIHDELGITAAIEDVEAATHGDPISFEFLKNANPDMIFVLDRDAAIGENAGAAEALLDNDLVKSLDAYKNNKIVYVDGYAWYMVAYGLTAMDTALGEVESALSR